MNRIFGCVSFASLLLAGACAYGQDAAIQKLEAEMARVSQIAGGDVGATAIHVESGRTANLRAAA